jgi:hypothetical protein
LSIQNLNLNFYAFKFTTSVHMRTQMNHFRCLGKTKKGERCKKTFLTSSYSDVIACSTHRNQVVTFQYEALHIESRLDVGLARVIASKMDDPAVCCLLSLCKGLQGHSKGLSCSSRNQKATVLENQLAWPSSFA